MVEAQLTYLSSRVRNPLGTTHIPSIPLSSARYPTGVFLDPGILHRNSGTKSRTAALAVVATLERRDCLSLGDNLRAVSLGRTPWRRLETGMQEGRSLDLTRSLENTVSPCQVPISPVRRSLVKGVSPCLIHRGVCAEMIRSPH